MNNLKVKVRFADDFDHDLALLFAGRDEQGVLNTLERDLTWRPLKSGEARYISEAPFVLDREMAQSLMDQLWTCGLRPTEGTGSAGSLTATQLHLKDMQTIAFDLLRKLAQS
jgi:hypothetical protein